MSEQNQDKTPVTASSADSLYDAAKELAIKMINVEQDPDLISVFSIARAHGYKVTSKFWQAELQSLGEVLRKIDEERALARAAAACKPKE